jgi:hypothetical protein
VYHVGRPRSARCPTLFVTPETLRRDHYRPSQKTVPPASIADTHSEYTVASIELSNVAVASPKSTHALCSAASAVTSGNIASLAYSTVLPDRTPSAYSFATRFCSLQVSCRVPKHPLTVVSWPRATRLSQRCRISGRGLTTSGVHLALQCQGILCLPQKPVYDPVHFAAIGR